MLQKRILMGGLLAVVIVGAQTVIAQNGNTPAAGQTPTPAPQNGAQNGGQKGAQTTPGSSQAGNDVARGLQLQRGEKLIGMEVLDNSNAKLGRVDDLILKPNGDIGYVVMSGNTPDTMTKEMVVPWSSVHANMAGAAPRGGEPMAGTDRNGPTDHLVFGADATRLSAAPSFDRTAWPKAGDNELFTASDRYFASNAGANMPDDRTKRPVDAGMSNSAYFRASQLRNQSVNDAAGMPAGTLGQLVIDPVAGRVNYVAFSTSSTAGTPGRTVALPWESIQASRRDDKDNFALSARAEQLQSAPEFVNGEEGWKRMSDPTYARDVYSHYAVRPYWNDAGANTPGAQPKRGETPAGGETPRRDAPKREAPKRDPNTPPK